MNSVAKREEFWAQTLKDNAQMYVGVYFEDGLLDMFRGKDVLEIGPGWGAQFKHVQPVCRSYALADIALDALANPVFKSVVTKLHLENYTTDYGVRFDIIHFWRVVHHILPDELPALVAWLSTHLRTDGVVCFDTPREQPNALDGMGTAPHTTGGLLAAFGTHFSVVSNTPSLLLNSERVLVMRKSKP